MIQIIRACSYIGVDPLGLQFCLEGFDVFPAEKGLAIIVHHCVALRDRCFCELNHKGRGKTGGYGAL